MSSDAKRRVAIRPVLLLTRVPLFLLLGAVQVHIGQGDGEVLVRGGTGCEVDGGDNLVRGERLETRGALGEDVAEEELGDGGPLDRDVLLVEVEVDAEGFGDDGAGVEGGVVSCVGGGGGEGEGGEGAREEEEVGGAEQHVGCMMLVCSRVRVVWGAEVLSGSKDSSMFDVKVGTGT